MNAGFQIVVALFSVFPTLAIAQSELEQRYWQQLDTWVAKSRQMSEQSFGDYALDKTGMGFVRGVRKNAR